MASKWATKGHSIHVGHGSCCRHGMAEGNEAKAAGLASLLVTNHLHQAQHGKALRISGYVPSGLRCAQARQLMH